LLESFWRWSQGDITKDILNQIAQAKAERQQQLEQEVQTIQNSTDEDEIMDSLLRYRELSGAAQQDMPEEQGGKSIMTAHWPKEFDDDFKAHYGLEETVDDLIAAKHELVVGGRNLRAIGNIPFAKKVDYILKPAGELDPYEIEVIQSLLNAESLQVDKGG